jgi:iron(III) transport system ATP-binding protein
VRDLRKSFDDVPILRGLELDAAAGEFVALLGPSGCGKTTALRMIAGFERADAGTIEVGGQLVADAKDPGGCWVPPEGRRVGMVFQDYALFPHLSVARNVAFGLQRNGRDRDARVQTALTTVGLDGLGERTPDQLSGGQQQRVALARALAPGPEVILLDEPFSNLDADLRASVREEVRQILRDAGATAVLVTHDQEEALSIADRVAVMLDGRIVQAGPPEELYHRPATRAVADFIGDAQFLPGQASGRRAVTALGEIPLHGAFEGPVDVMLRPEMLRLAPPSDDEPANATIVSRAFFGHDQLLTLHLDNGPILKARLGAYGGFRPGDRVGVTVRGGALAYPREQ